MQLNLPSYPFKMRTNDKGKREIFDTFRQKYIVLTPEEWVRQHFLHFLVAERNFPPMLLSIEKAIKVNQMLKRFDAVAYSRSGHPLVLMEFKSPKVKLDHKVVDQIGRYNIKLQLDYLIISNGLSHYFGILDYTKNSFQVLDQIPIFESLLEKER